MAKIQPGLERIADLLRNVNFPWQAIHVAGTNGKGSICHYASSLIVGRGIKVGMFTSPHLVDRWDCISINGKPVQQKTFRKVEQHFLQINASRQIGASPFEILTATAFTVFNDANVKVGVVEVGMGGRLDSTNVLNNQAVSVISKIARDHEGFLGSTLSEIAAHKAGILRPNVPYVISSANEDNVINVVNDYANEIGAGARLSTRHFDLQDKLYDSSKWHRITNTMAPFQQENMKMAVVAVMQTLESMNQVAKPRDIGKTLLANLKAHHHGRQERVQVPPVFRNPAERKNQILVDGAHNPDAAKVLDTYVTDNLRYGQTPSKDRPKSGWPVTWVLAMTEGKDAREYLATLLKPGDNVVTTTFGPVDGMPWVKPMDPKELLGIAQSVEPQITGVHVPVAGPLRALSAAKYISSQLADWTPIVLTGSLYLVGDLHRELRQRSSKTWWTDTDEATTADRESILKMQAEERKRVNAVLVSKKGSFMNAEVVPDSRELETEEQTRLQDEIDALDREVQRLEVEEERLAEERPAALDPIGATQDELSLSALERLERDERRFAELNSTPEQIVALVAKAKKAEADLARHAERLAAAAKERAEKAEKRAQQKERLERRRERRLEKKRLGKERKEQMRVTLKEQPRHPYRLSLKPFQEDKWRTTTKTGTKETPDAPPSLSDRASTAPKGPPRSDTEDQDALSVLSTSGQNRSSFDKPQPANSSISPTLRYVPSNEKAPATQSHSEFTIEKTGDSQSSSENLEEGVKVHMHYSNVSEPRRSKMKVFPLEKRTRAWSNPRGRQHPGYKTPGQPSVVNYYEHEYGRRRSS